MQLKLHKETMGILIACGYLISSKCPRSTIKVILPDCLPAKNETDEVVSKINVPLFMKPDLLFQSSMLLAPSNATNVEDI